MYTAKLNNTQTSIIKDICNKQIQSLIRVSMVITDIEEEYKLSSLIVKFDCLKRYPNEYLKLDSDSMGLFKHNLFNNEEEYSRRHSYKPLGQLWRQLNINDYFKPSLT